MPRYSLNLLSKYDPDELTGPELVSRGIGDAIQSYVDRQDSLRQERNTMAAAGAQRISAAPTAGDRWQSRPRWLGGTGRSNSEINRQVGPGSIGDAITPYVIEGQNGSRYSIDPFHQARIDAQGKRIALEPVRAARKAALERTRKIPAEFLDAAIDDDELARQFLDPRPREWKPTTQAEAVDFYQDTHRAQGPVPGTQEWYEMKEREALISARTRAKYRVGSEDDSRRTTKQNFDVVSAQLSDARSEMDDAERVVPKPPQIGFASPSDSLAFETNAAAARSRVQRIRARGDSLRTVRDSLGAELQGKPVRPKGTGAGGSTEMSAAMKTELQEAADLYTRAKKKDPDKAMEAYNELVADIERRYRGGGGKK